VPAKAYKLPEWTPDLGGNVLTRAVNVRAVANGYAPVKAPQAVTSSLGAPFYGAGAFIASDGSSTLLGATNAGVFYAYDGVAWDLVFTAVTTQPFRFAQYGDSVYVATGGMVAAYNLITAATSNPTNAPDVVDLAQVRDFVMGITTDNQIQWCQFNNPSVWTTGTNQADKQPSLWGQARRIVGGEYGIVIADRSIVRVTYVGVEAGLDIIWQFDEISAEVGVMASGSVCNVGRLIFFLSERGFMMCDGNEVSPIADEKFNRWFFDTYSRADIANIWSAIDPRYSLALWAMPGTPGRIVAYNWVLKRATTFEVDIAGLFTGYSSGTPLDALDAIYGDLDSIPVSLDDPSLQGGNPLLLIAGADNALYALTGDNLEAAMRLENIEPTQGKRSRIRSLRLVSDATDASATIDARMKAGDGESIRSTGSMRGNGKLPIRATADTTTSKSLSRQERIGVSSKAAKLSSRRATGDDPASRISPFRSSPERRRDQRGAAADRCVRTDLGPANPDDRPAH
jgi:hypothetical protein